MRTLAPIVAAALLTTLPAIAQQTSPYAGQQHREIKALSADEVRDYLDGKGMGLARAAELNGYPGPMHVLELAGPLALTAEQRAKTEALLASMRARAVEAGRELVGAERELDRLFAEREASPARVAEATARIRRRAADVRRVHLEAHVEQAAILTPDQVRRYADLRGYAGAAPEQAHTGHRRHH